MILFANKIYIVFEWKKRNIDVFLNSNKNIRFRFYWKLKVCF